MMGRNLAILIAVSLFASQPRERWVESIVPSLTYGADCWSTVNLQNLGDRAVLVEIEPHRADGALVPLLNLSQTTRRLDPGQRVSYQLAIEEDTTGAWVRVREKVPSPELSPVVAVSGTTESILDNQLRTTIRQVVYPVRNPWVTTGVDDRHGHLLSMINASERPARASLCYSSGNYYSVPSETHAVPQVTPICSHSFEVQIPPFATRQFPLERESSSQFTIKTLGDAIVLEILRPLEAGVKIYTVDSTIKFGGEAARPQ
jgi:hypothetical protein